MSDLIGQPPRRSGRGGVSFLSQGDGSVAGKVLNDDHWGGAYFKEFFPGNIPLAVKSDGYSVPTGLLADINIARFDRWTAAYHLKSAQTLLAPQANINGYLLAGLDVAASEGVEYLPGQHAGAPNSFGLTVGGTRPPVFLRLDLALSVVANAADCAIGFRKAEAFQAALGSYTDFAVINLQAGTVNVQTRLNSGPVATLDSGKTVTDTTRVVVEAQVFTDGKVKLLVDGDRVGDGAFQFDSGDVLIPTIFFLQGAAGTEFRWYEAEGGRLWHVRRDGGRR